MLALLLASICISGVDIRLLQYINLHRNTSLDRTFIYITNSAAMLAYGIPILLILVSLFKEDSIAQKNSLYIISAVIVSALIASACKYGIARPRPFLTYSFIQSVAEGGSPSFPSGHTCDAFALATAISLTYRKWYIVVPFFLWALLVGYSRMDLGVHYPSDVLGGIIIGFNAALLCHITRYWINKKKGNA